MAILDNENGFVDPSNVSITPTGNKWGLIQGLIGVVLSLIFFMTGMMDMSGTKSNLIPNIVSYGAVIATLYMALKAHKEEDLGGYLSLGRAVKMGAYIGLIAGVLSAIFLFVYFKFIQTDFLNTITETAISKAEEKGQDPDEVRKGMEMVSWMFSPGFFSIIGLLTSVFMNVIFALILGLIMKKDPPRPF
jgi:energy-converting hydrogenase Eha subunit A